METKEWTLMFYFASDNPLVISIVSQLKALKAAGFHQDVNVVAQFDPYAEGTPTHIFDVNLINKLKFPGKSKIGFDKEDSFVRNLIEDKLWGNEFDRKKDRIRDVLDRVMSKNHGEHYVAPNLDELPKNGTTSHLAEKAAEPLAVSQNGGPHDTTSEASDEPSPCESLQSFLDLCQSQYPAKHYMLFIVGHGVVVGNDIFLYDEHAKEHSITLKQMGDVLSEFKGKLDKQGAAFELISFNSCSVSSLEVAYQLQGTANYLLASQGATFVGSWPYREILIRIFKEVDRNLNDIRELIGDIFYYCIHNSADFLLAGYSYQLTLCDLWRVSDLNDALSNLSTAMIEALSPQDEKKNDAASTYVILYSHWKAQSFFDEMYIDIYDFCSSIVDRCERIEEGGGEVKAPLSTIRDECVKVMEIVAKPDLPNGKSVGKISKKPKVVTAAEFVGPAYQYSHGLSVYFPWSRPSDGSRIMQQYKTYRIYNDFAPERASWFDFLDAYFTATQRKAKSVEVGFLKNRLEKSGLVVDTPVQTEEQKLQEDIANLVYSGEGPLGGFALAKSDPWDKMGNDCKCPSVKNYPRDTRSKETGRRRTAQAMPLSGSLIGDFLSQSE